MTAAILTWQAHYFPEIGYDESAAWLGVRLFRDHSFGFDIDPVAVMGFSRGLVMDCYPPVYYAVSGLIYRLAGFGIDQARWATILFMAGTALLAYSIARRLVGPGAGLISLGAYLLIPLWVYPSPVARPDVAVPFFLLICLWLLSEARLAERRSMLMAGAGFAYALSVLSHFVALMAGPALAFLLWRDSGLRFWANRGFWWFVAAWTLPMVGYAIMLHPYETATLASLVNYSASGQRGTAVLASWPIRPLFQHWEALWTLGHFAASCIIAAILIPLMLCAVPRRYFKFNDAQRLWLAVPAALAALASIYPNIGTIGYYAPLYAVPAAVAVGIATAVFSPALSAVKVLAGAALIVIAIDGIYDRAQARIAAVQHVPVTAALDFFDSLGFDPARPVVGIAHWIFAKSAANLESFMALRPNAHGAEFPVDLQVAIPRYAPISQAQAIVIDASTDIIAEQVMMTRQEIARYLATGSTTMSAAEFGGMRQTISYRMPQYRFADDKTIAQAYLSLAPDYLKMGDAINLQERAVFAHPMFHTARETVFVPSVDHDAVWPTLGAATGAGPVRLAVQSDCHRIIPLDARLHRDHELDLFIRRFPLSASRSDGPLLVRIVMAEGSGFATAFPTSGEAEAGIVEANHASAPYGVAGGLLHFYLPTGERGRDLLLPGAILQDGMLVIFAPDEDRVARIELALPKRAGELCAPNDGALLDGLASAIAGPEPAPLLRDPPPSVVRAGEPFTVYFNDSKSGEVHIWQNGKIATNTPFRDALDIKLSIPAGGNAGVEIWIDSGHGRKLGGVYFLEAR
ncbi:MAG TPA: glycosyltransferase family 39 protein [Rhizomicrobium sp.]|nr:glycosyltransferase family 39 protein [Rhizomicrobium sp.]